MSSTKTAEPEDKTCAMCGEPADKRCSRCQLTWYCSVEHQKSDWKRHKKSDCVQPSVSQFFNKLKSFVAAGSVNITVMTRISL